MNLPFVYTNPAAGQQAVAYAQMQHDGDLQRLKMVNDMYTGMGRNAVENSRNLANLELTRAQLGRDARNDVERKRQFDTSIQLEKDRLAAVTTAQGIREKQIQDEKDAAYDLQFQQFQDLANNFNARNWNPSRAATEKLPSGLVFDPATMKVVPLMRPRVIQTPTIGSQYQSIDDLRNRTRGTVGAGPITTPIPSPGFTPQATDFRVNIPYPGADFELSPYDSGVPSVISQEDMLRFAYPQSYEDAIRSPNMALPY